MVQVREQQHKVLVLWRGKRNGMGMNERFRCVKRLQVSSYPKGELQVSFVTGQHVRPRPGFGLWPLVKITLLYILLRIARKREPIWPKSRPCMMCTPGLILPEAGSR